MMTTEKSASGPFRLYDATLAVLPAKIEVLKYLEAQAQWNSVLLEFSLYRNKWNVIDKTNHKESKTPPGECKASREDEREIAPYLWPRTFNTAPSWARKYEYVCFLEKS